MYLTGIGTAVPARRFKQADCWEAFQQAPQYSTLNARSQALLRKVLTGDNGIVTRHLAMNELSEAFALNPDVLHARFAENAPKLSVQAAEKALAAAGLSRPAQPSGCDASRYGTDHYAARTHTSRAHQCAI